jgi:hypothetical protein
MEHQDHSTENGAPEHLISPITTATTSSGTPSFRVYKDMGTENFANGQVLYKGPDGSSKNCLDALNDDERYNYGCRCGCSAVFSGFGRDIKAAFSIGQSTFPAILALGDTGTNELLYDASTGTVESVTPVTTETVTTPTSIEIKRPFVFDRYIKKAIFGLSDDEIDALDQEGETFELSNRNPPGIGELAWSLSSQTGPFVVVEYVREKVKVGKQVHDVWHALVKTPKGGFVSLPLADLVSFKEELPPEKKSRIADGFQFVAFYLLLTVGVLAAFGGFVALMVFLKNSLQS